MVFRECKLTFKRFFSWFTLEIASCQLFGSGRLAKINFWFGNFTKSVILYLIQKVYFCEPKKDVYYPNEEENQNRLPVWRNTWNICIASHSQSFLRHTFLAEIEGRNTETQPIPPKRENFPEDDNIAWNARTRDFGENLPATPFGFTVLRKRTPPTLDSHYDMSVTVDGDDSIAITGGGGIVESYATALDNKLNPENQPE